METGEYFLSEKEINERKMEMKKKKQQKKQREKQELEAQKEEDENEKTQLQKEKQRERQRAAKKENFKRSEPSIDELKEKFLSKPIKKVKF